ncbi:MAG: hypothetical protein ACE5GE_02125 [Phycisphaerae bacterium]
MRSLTTPLRVCLLWALAICLLGASARQDPTPEQKADNQAESPPATDSAPADQADTGVPTPRQPSPEDIIREFQKQRPQAVPVLPSGGADETIIRSEPGGEGSARGVLLPDGARLVDRTGRIMQEGPWWVLSFEPDSTGQAEMPMKLLPNQSLERMVRESRGGVASVLFIVSGEVTEFRGENFLLPRKVLRKRNLGNLKK